MFSVGAEEGDSDVVVSGTVLGSTEVVVVAGTPVVVVSVVTADDVTVDVMVDVSVDVGVVVAVVV